MEPTIGEFLFYIFAIIGALIFIVVREGRQYPLGKVEWVEDCADKYDRKRRK